MVRFIDRVLQHESWGVTKKKQQIEASSVVAARLLDAHRRCRRSTRTAYTEPVAVGRPNVNWG